MDMDTLTINYNYLEEFQFFCLNGAKDSPSSEQNNIFQNGAHEDAYKKEKYTIEYGKRSFKLYKLFIHNNDATPMNFVVQVIKVVFSKAPSEAYAIMYEAHCYGKAVLGVFAKDIADAYIKNITFIARKHGYTLHCSKIVCKK